MKAYVFSECATKEKPDTDTTRLLEKAMDGAELTRQEKDKIADICYGIFGSQFAGYRLAGWQWDLRHCLNKYVVESSFGDLHYYYAPDKTSLRKALRFVKRIINTN